MNESIDSKKLRVLTEEELEQITGGEDVWYYQTAAAKLATQVGRGQIN